jgi:hypothetical protein
MIDDAFHTYANDSRWEAQEYIKEKFFTANNSQITQCCSFCKDLSICMDACDNMNKLSCFRKCTA